MTVSDAAGREWEENGSMSGEEGADPGEEVAVHAVHPFQARKDYICPGCQQTVAAGTGHLVVVPRQDASRRRHWHRPCWAKRSTRRPGR